MKQATSSSDSTERLKNMLTLLDQLQVNNGRDGASVQQRAELSKRIMAALTMPTNEVAERMGVSKLTVERWALGPPKGNAPRTNQIEALRGLVQAELRNSGRARLPLTPFGAYSIGVYRAPEHFFELTVDSTDDKLCVEAVYVFKSLLGFHGGIDAATRDSLRVLLGEHESLRIHYIYPFRFDGSETEAQRTFNLMKNHPSLAEVNARIIGHGLDAEGPTNQGNMELIAQLGIGFTFCSAFVLIYNADGKKRFARNLDILVEIPCQRYDSVSGRPIDAGGPEFIFVELPQNLVSDLWAKWDAVVKKLLESETTTNEQQ